MGKNSRVYILRALVFGGIKFGGFFIIAKNAKLNMNKVTNGQNAGIGGVM